MALINSLYGTGGTAYDNPYTAPSTIAPLPQSTLSPTTASFVTGTPTTYATPSGPTSQFTNMLNANPSTSGAVAPNPSSGGAPPPVPLSTTSPVTGGAPPTNPMYQGDPVAGGFAGQYLPGALGNLFDMPGLALQDVLRGRGVSNPLNSGLYYQMEPYADVANEALLMMNPNTWVTPEQAANYLNSFFGNLMTRGGTAPDFSMMMANMMGTPQANSPMNAFLNVADPQEQVRNFMSMGRAAGAMGLHPYYADAFNAMMAQAGNAYLNAMTKGTYTGNFAPYFQTNYNQAGGLTR